MLLGQLHICYLCTALSSAEMDGFHDYEKAMLVGQNKQLQILRVAVSTLHKGVEISVQLHRDLMDITPLLQEAMNTVRLRCGSRLLHVASWPCSAPLSPSHQGCLWACCKIGGCLLQVGGCCMWACCKIGGCLLRVGGLLQIGGGCLGAVPGLQSSRA